MAEQFGVVIGAVATFITAIGGIAWWRGRGETKAGEGPSQIATLKQSLDRLASAMERQLSSAEKNNAHMEKNLAHFEALRSQVGDLRDIAHRLEIEFAKASGRR